MRNLLIPAVLAAAFSAAAPPLPPIAWHNLPTNRPVVITNKIDRLKLRPDRLPNATREKRIEQWRAERARQRAKFNETNETPAAANTKKSLTEISQESRDKSLAERRAQLRQKLDTLRNRTNVVLYPHPEPPATNAPAPATP